MTTQALGRTDLLPAVGAAVRAPSIHNSQPWLFRVTPGAVDVYADRDRQLPVADPHGTALRLSCGAAILNLRLAMAHLGFDPEVSLLPDRLDPDHLARVVAGRARHPTPTEGELYAAIPRRHSNRHPFVDTPVPLDVRGRLVRAARAEGAWLNLLVGPAALAMGSELIRTADRVLSRDPAYLTEQSAWIGPDFSGPQMTIDHDWESEPLVAVLGSAADSPFDELVAGQALQRVLLTATSAGLLVSLISQPVYVPRLREDLRIGLRRYGQPQILIRAGYGIPDAPSPRRPLSEVLLTDAPMAENAQGAKGP